MLESKLFISFINSDDHLSTACKRCCLSDDDVIIYTLYLPEYIKLTNDLIRFLNTEERNRADRFYQEKDQTQFIICRAILKFILAALTKSDVKNINLEYDFNKKPYLGSHPWLHFNVSHSDDFALIAISQCKIGIDIEYISKDFDYLPLLPDIFSENEILFVQNAKNKLSAFYTLWTRKEAFVKAVGKGIDDDFKNTPSLDGEHDIDSNILKTSKNWQVFSFNLEDHYLGSVAFESSPSISKNLVWHTIPNTMKDLLEIAK
jgi:4'-phosphopantetheinyl transferase